MDDRLMAVAQRILDGGEVAEINFGADFRTPEKAAELANNLWIMCRRFQDDADIRARDAEYDRRQRKAVEEHLQAYLNAIGDDR